MTLSMRHALVTVSMVAGWGVLPAGCNSNSTAGNTGDGGAVCQTGQTCTDPNTPGAWPDPYGTSPRSGSTAVGGAATAQFDPKAAGNRGVKTDPTGAVVLTTAGFVFNSKFIWIANSGEGTESKVDTTTNKELARYCTRAGCKADPSRSTVSLLGDAVVTNRANYFGFAIPANASVTKIAGDPTRCVDRNGNGVIDTNPNPGPITAASPWFWAAGMANSPDECVIWSTDLTKDRNGAVVAAPGTLPRAAAYDAVVSPDGTDLTTYVYVGLYQTQEVVRLDSKTGAIVKQFVTKARPYHFAMDKFGALWIRDANLANVTKIDIPNGDTEYNYLPPPCAYGMSADSRGYIYTAGGNCVSRFDPTQPAKGWEQLVLPGACSTRGLNLDSKFNLYVADTCAGLYKVDATKTYGQGMTFVSSTAPRGNTANSYYLGIGIDLNEDPWVVSMGQNSVAAPGAQGIIYHASKDLSTTVAVNVGDDPYTYSDMTGSELRYSGSPKGYFHYIFKSDCAPLKTTWTQVNYTVNTPAGTEVDIQTRGAGDLTTLQTTVFGAPIMIPPALPGPINPNNIEGIDNTYLELQFTLQATTLGLSPAIQNVKADYTCG